MYDEDESGAFHMAFSTSLCGSVQRRLRSEEPWDLDQNFEHELRWSDDTWDWCVACDDAPDQLPEIRRQLSDRPGPTDPE